MANEMIKQNYKDIANAIRAKTGENGTMSADEMPGKIASIETGITPSGTKNIEKNGTYDVTNYASAYVDVSGFTYAYGDYGGYYYLRETSQFSWHWNDAGIFMPWADGYTEGAIRLGFDFSDGEPYNARLQSCAFFDTNGICELQNWGTSDAKISGTCVIDGVLPGVAEFVPNESYDNLIYMLLSSYGDEVVSIYNEEFPDDPVDNYQEIVSDHEQWAQALAESWASLWFIKACGSSNGSVALEISFVDQVNHEIGTYEGSFSLSDVQVLTSTAGS